jgi:arginyl-tRNA synthetase
LPARALARLEAALSGLAGARVQLERPSKAEHGDYATNAALQLGPAQRRPPRELAQELAEKAAALPDVERAEVAGPGFVNLWLGPDWYREALGEILEAGAGFGGGQAERAEHVQVEMVSANPTGPIVVSAARNGAYGDSVARLLAFAGHRVEREYYYNDSGRQMELFRASVEAVREGREPPEDGYRGAYIEELARAEGDPVPAVLAQIEATLERFGIHFDSWARQSELEQHVPELVEKIDTYEKDGAVWARSSAYGDDKDQVVIRSNGLPTYRAADIAYVEDKLRRGFDKAIYVLGADHHGTRNWYGAVARMLGYDPDRIEVLIYQLVHLLRAGELAKMAKRTGDIVALDELIDEVGVDAARWYLVSRSHDQAIEIDVDLAAEKSQKNPVYYVQYVAARIAGIMRNAGDAAVGADPPAAGLSPQERDLVKRLVEFPAVVAEATERRGPHQLTNYAIYVADDFHRFYHEHRVLDGGDAQPFRLGLCRATQAVVTRALDLVGVEAPERM